MDSQAWVEKGTSASSLPLILASSFRGSAFGAEHSVVTSSRNRSPLRLFSLITVENSLCPAHLLLISSLRSQFTRARGLTRLRTSLESALILSVVYCPQSADRLWAVCHNRLRSPSRYPRTPSGHRPVPPRSIRQSPGSLRLLIVPWSQGELLDIGETSLPGSFEPEKIGLARFHALHGRGRTITYSSIYVAFSQLQRRRRQTCREGPAEAENLRVDQASLVPRGC